MTKKRKKKSRAWTREEREQMKRKAAEKLHPLLRRARHEQVDRQVDPPKHEELKPYTGEDVTHHDD